MDESVKEELQAIVDSYGDKRYAAFHMGHVVETCIKAVAELDRLDADNRRLARENKQLLYRFIEMQELDTENKTPSDRIVHEDMTHLMSAKKLRKFTDTASTRLNSRSLIEIRQAMEEEIMRLRRTFDPEISDKPFSLTTAINAILVGYLMLPSEQRDQIVLPGVDRLKELLARDGPDKELFIHIQ